MVHPSTPESLDSSTVDTTDHLGLVKEVHEENDEFSNYTLRGGAVDVGVEEAMQNFEDLISLFDGTMIEPGLLGQLFSDVFDQDLLCTSSFSPRLRRQNEQEETTVTLNYDDLFQHFVEWSMSILEARVLSVKLLAGTSFFDYSVEISLPDNMKKIFTSTALVRDGKIANLRRLGTATRNDAAETPEPEPAPASPKFRRSGKSSQPQPQEHWRNTCLEHVGAEGGHIQIGLKGKMGSVRHSLVMASSRHERSDLELVDFREADSAQNSCLLLQERTSKKAIALCQFKVAGGELAFVYGRTPMHKRDRSQLTLRRAPFYPWYKIEEHGGIAYSIHKWDGSAYQPHVIGTSCTPEEDEQAKTTGMPETECMAFVAQNASNLHLVRAKITIAKGADPFLLMFLSAMVACAGREGTILRLLSYSDSRIQGGGAWEQESKYRQRVFL